MPSQGVLLTQAHVGVVATSEELSAGFSELAAEAVGTLDELLDLRGALVEQHPAVAAAAEEADPPAGPANPGKRGRDADSDVDESDTVQVTPRNRPEFWESFENSRYLKI